jgi:hypothetical protein
MLSACGPITTGTCLPLYLEKKEDSPFKTNIYFSNARGIVNKNVEASTIKK